MPYFLGGALAGFIGKRIYEHVLDEEDKAKVRKLIGKGMRKGMWKFVTWALD